MRPALSKQWGGESGENLTVFMPGNDEAGPDPTDDGWALYGGAGTRTLEYTNDNSRGNVVHVTTTDAGQVSARVILGDRYAEGLNPNDAAWGDADRRHVGLWVRNAKVTQLQLFVQVRTNLSDNQQIIYLTTSAGDPYYNGNDQIVQQIGTQYNDGNWHYLEFDLDATAGYLGETILAVNGVFVRGNDYYVDDIVVSGGALERSYAVVPGAAIGGVLGSFTGPNVTPENGNTIRYFHYNELGTVLAQTDASGDTEGAWEPDHFGNYAGRYTYAGSPARPELGLTGQIYDPAVGAYMFRFRWLDPERGRWLSEEPSGMEGPNLYHFVYNHAVFAFDMAGLGSGYGWPVPLPEDILATDEELFEKYGPAYYGFGGLVFGVITGAAAVEATAAVVGWLGGESITSGSVLGGLGIIGGGATAIDVTINLCEGNYNEAAFELGSFGGGFLSGAFAAPGRIPGVGRLRGLFEEAGMGYRPSGPLGPAGYMGTMPTGLAAAGSMGFVSSGTSVVIIHSRPPDPEIDWTLYP